jgi:hypothetical protein
MLINEIVQVNELFGKKRSEATHIDNLNFNKPIEYNGQKYLYDKETSRWKEKVTGTIVAPGSTVDKALLKTAGFDKQGYAKSGKGSMRSKAGHWLGQDTTDGSIGQRTGAAAGAVVGGVVGGAGKLLKKGYDVIKRGTTIPDAPDKIFVTNTNSGFRIGDTVKWTATKSKGKIKKGQEVSSQIVGFEGYKYKFKGQTQIVQPGMALFKTASGGGLPFQKPITLLTLVR